MVKKKYNFQVDSDEMTVSIKVSSLLFPKPVILQAAYHFIEEGRVIVEGEADLVTVTLLPYKELKESELEELAYDFNIQLISSFVEDIESRKHAELRNTMMKAALSSPPQPPISSPPPTQTSQSISSQPPPSRSREN